MDDKERTQFVDDLLEASLARYSSVTSRPGLEGRVLANAKAAQARRSVFVWAGWLAAGATAALIVFGVFSLTRRGTIPAPPKTVEVVKPGVGTGLRHVPVTGPPIQQAHVLRKPQLQRPPQATSLARAEVRLPVFPSPSPITEQEKLLAQHVHITPTDVSSAPSTDGTVIPELEFKPLNIAPLDAEETESKIN